MKRFLLVLSAVLVGSATMGAFAAQAKDVKGFTPGNWEIHYETTMKGLPVAMPAMKTTLNQCLTQEDAVPKSDPKDSKCKASAQTIQGNKVSWTLDCDTESGKVTGTGSLTFKEDAFEGSQTVRVKTGQGQDIDTVTKMTGRRVGDCKK